ncbi:hypothetical protein F4677DRAFT_281508 [Hypoxylon crocopeplum]|nr:hypothetical protein F4677DRAFT_281508 [Hypoxylon crocopeplum]
MRQNFYDGLPVNCAAPGHIAPDNRRNCATQSTGASMDLPNIAHCHISSPTLQVIETGQHSQPLSQPQSSNFYPGTINTSIPAYQYPQIRSSSSSSQSIFPTPPSTTCEGEDFDGYSYHGSPTSATCGGQSVPSFPAHSPETSPASWSPTGPHPMNFQQPFAKESDPMSAYNFQQNLPLQYEQQSHMSSPYEDHNYSPAALGEETMAQQNGTQIMASVAEPDPAIVLYESPSPRLESSNVDHESRVAGEGSRQLTQETNEDGGKADEPYAQLIHKAFLSRENHAMSLQELYQWFRENTDKDAKCDPTTAAKGWQNSIRHNLSMNQAFSKRERKPNPDDPGSAKRATEWFLEDWAINGVQSTTRYRSKGTSSRRGPGIQKKPRANLSGRANSGRKGGLSTSKARSEATKKARSSRHNHVQTFASSNLRGDMRRIAYDQRAGYQYHHMASHLRGEPINAPDPGPSNMMLSANPMQAAVLQAPDPSHEFSYAPNMAAYGQPNQHHEYHTGESIYTLEQVTGIYQGSHMPIPEQGGQVQASAMNSGLNGLFEHPGESQNDRFSLPYFGPATSVPYQP